MNIKTVYKSNIKKFRLLQKTRKWRIWVIFSFFLITLLFVVFCFFFNNLKFSIPDDRYLWLLSSIIISSIGLPFCGTSIQAVTKNEIAGPTTLGFLPITGTGSILAILLSKNFNYSNGIYYQYLFTILLTIFVIVILFIGSIFKENRKNLVVLFGLFIGIVFSAFNSLMMFLYPQDINISPWLGQTNYIYSWQKFYISLSMIIIGMIFY